MTFDPANPQDPVDVWWETEYDRDLEGAIRLSHNRHLRAMEDPKLWTRFRKLAEAGRTYDGYPAMR